VPILAIDLGTSSVKAAVVERDGTLLGTGHGSIETLLSEDGGAEQDAELVWQAVLNAADRALANLPDRGAVRGVAIASQYSSIVPVDTRGQPTANMVVWMDKRGSPEHLRKLPGGHRMKPSVFQMWRWLRIHGVPPLGSGSDSLAHMRWIALAKPDAYARTATFLEPMDYLAMRFSGRAATNPCSSFMMLLTDNRRPEAPYHPTLLEWSGIDAAKLPEVIPIDEPLGTVLPTVAKRLGLRPEVVVFPPLNDTQAGGMGASAFEGNHAGMSMGTTGVYITHVDFKRTDILNSLVSMPCPLSDRYFVMAEAGIGGGAVEYFLEHLVFASDRFGDHDLSEKFAALEHAIEPIPPGSEGLLFLPWLTGSITPAEDGKVRGGFLNMSLQTKREHMAQAVLEGVAFNMRWVQNRVTRFAKRDVTHLKFYGGGALSGAWSQIFADVLQRPVQQLRDPEYVVSRGLALLGYHRLGELSLSEIERAVPVAATFEPRREASQRYDDMFEQFVRVFKKNRDVFRALNVGS
jgi:xylulokinase